MKKQRQVHKPKHWLVVFACFATASLLAWSSQAEAGAPLRINLEEALEQAFRMSPVLEARRAELREAEARLLGAGINPFNPEVEISAGNHRGENAGTNDLSAAISQEVEIAGQRRKRKSIAATELAAAQSEFLRSQRVLTAQVRGAFAASLRGRELLDIAQSDAKLTRELLNLSSRRLEEGAGTYMELNISRSATGRAERTLRLAEAVYATARNGLAEVIGFAPDQPLEPVGSLPVPERADLSVDELVASALAGRSDLEALRRFTKAAFEEIRLARSGRIPNLRFGAFYTEEEGTDVLTGLALSLPIPLFNRNQGRIAEASAQADRLSAEGQAAELTVRREVADAVAIYRSAQKTTTALRDLVVGTLEENLELLQRALQAGKIGASEVLVFRREFVEGQRQFVEALFEARIASIALDLATGRLITPTTPEKEILP